MVSGVPPPAPPLVGSTRAAAMLRVTKQTVARWAKEGRLPVHSTTLGGHRRFRLEDIEAAREQMAEGAA